MLKRENGKVVKNWKWFYKVVCKVCITPVIHHGYSQIQLDHPFTLSDTKNANPRDRSIDKSIRCIKTSALPKNDLRYLFK